MKNNELGIMGRKFQRKMEDFACEKCGFYVKGDGYTNHCPKCLWSKHVDINPGDRAEGCGGMMKPVGVEKTKKGFDIIYRCEKCFKKGSNRSRTEDDFNVLIKVSGLVGGLNW